MTLRSAFVIDSLCLVAGTYKVDVAVHRRNGVPYRLSSVALYHPRDLAAQRDRHRQAATPVDVFERHSYLWSVRTAEPLQSCRDSKRRRLPRASAHRGGRVVFTNGVFDLLHPGHVRYLSDARALGDALIVGVNSDRSVRANKGPARPITPEGERAELVASLRSVDAVTVFDEDTPHALITAVQPDVLVKGADWGPDNIVGRDVVEARGGTVVRIELAEGILVHASDRDESRGVGAVTTTAAPSLSLRSLLGEERGRRPRSAARQSTAGLTPASKALAAVQPPARASSRRRRCSSCPTDRDVEQMTSDARFFYGALEGASAAAVEQAVLPLPSIQVDPYRGMTPHFRVAAARARALHAAAAERRG